MKTVDDVGLKMCEFQGSLFEKSSGLLNCSSRYFIYIFMNSHLAERMDDVSFMIESRDENLCLKELADEKNLTIGQKKYPDYVLRWIGYIYRYFAISYEMRSARVYRIIKPDELYGLYEAYHSLDNEEAVRRIAEAKNIGLEKDYLAIARKIYL